MKAMKKIMSLLLVLTIGLTLTAYAAEPAINPLAVETGGVITVRGPQLEGKDVTIVRMFTGNMGAAGQVGYTMDDPWQGFFNAQLNKEHGADTASEEAYAYVSELLSEKTAQPGTTLIDFAKAAKTEYNNSPAAFAELAETRTADETNSVCFNNLTSGYYLVLPANGSTASGCVTDAMLVNVRDAKPVNIQLKTEYPIVNKVIVEGNEEKPGSSAQIGDTLKFRLTARTPNMAEFETYNLVLKDTLSKGLTLNQNSVKVAVVKADTSTIELIKRTDYRLTAPGTGGESFIVEFKDLKTLAENKNFSAGDTIKIEYTAILNEDAATGTTPNTNKAELEYSTSPDGSKHGTSNPAETKTYTFEVQIHKYANDVALLPGAVFQLQTNPDGTPIKLLKVSDTQYRMADPAETQDNGAVPVDSFQTVAKKNITIKGLKEGKYQLIELEAPEGYNKLTKPIEFEIQTQYEADGSLSVGYPKYAVSGADATENNVINVQNKNGAFLPETGSIGTVGLTIVGAALVICGIGFTSYRNRERE